MTTPNGYEMTTTFWEDFCIADAFGTTGIYDTYKNAFSSWKHNYIFLTELVIVLNWKIWQHWQQGNEDYSKLYDRLWKEADAYAMDNLKDEELQFYIKVTD